jgi:hypothetical protein
MLSDADCERFGRVRMNLGQKRPVRDTPVSCSGSSGFDCLPGCRISLGSVCTFMCLLECY